MLVRWRGLGRRLLSTIPFDEAGEIIAIGSVGPEDFLVKQTLDAAARTHLIRIALSTHRPAHFAVPAATKYNHCGSCQACGHQAERPFPALLLSLCLLLSLYLVFVHLGHLLLIRAYSDRP